MGGGECMWRQLPGLLVFPVVLCSVAVPRETCSLVLIRPSGWRLPRSLLIIHVRFLLRHLHRGCKNSFPSVLRGHAWMICSVTVKLSLNSKSVPISSAWYRGASQQTPIIGAAVPRRPVPAVPEESKELAFSVPSPRPHACP